ncbi:hypothetical protein AcW1_001487 [Taiwanofungus camphoratus]|nr:hypothetical protein AcV5_003789 [Antrodia cinnamomea]KAI0937700.1 hypothetical protein AcV7_003665 [Antrodia cinnamomea]KAI0945215.1 hypothetical protein AcW1_001487 [Antrodia cinnamomea]
MFFTSPPSPPPLGEKIYGPVPESEAGLHWKKKAVPEGARYCEELDAYVPADLPYCIRGIKQARAPLKRRVLTRGFWRPAGKDAAVDRMVCAIGLTHNKMNLVPLAKAQKDASIKYRGV